MFGIGRIIKERFPDRQIYHKSGGQIRYFAATTEMQVTALLVACSIAVWLTISIVDLAISSRAQLLLERRIASERDIEAEDSEESFVDEEYSAAAEALENIDEAIREARSRLMREQLELERATAEHERLQRIVSLTEADAQAVIEIFRLENKRTKLEGRIEWALSLLITIIVPIFFAILIYLKQKKDLQKIHKI